MIPCEACVRERRKAEEERERAAEEAKAAAELRHRIDHLPEYLARMGVTRKYQHVTLEGFDPNPDRLALEAAKAFVRDFLRGERPSLYLYSSRPGERIAPGCGKTHLAVAVLRELASNPTVRLEDLGFAFVPLMLMEIQDTFKHPERSELSVVRKYVKPELLVWDDLGCEKLSDYAARTLYTILHQREGKSNIFTSNLSLADLEGRDPSGYTQRIVSRIAGEADIICLTGRDRRLRVA